MFSLTSLVPLSAVVSLSFFFVSIFKRVLWKKALCFAFNDGCPPLLLTPPPPPWQPVTTRCLLPLHVFNNNCVAYFSAMGLALNFKGLVQLYVCVYVCVCATCGRVKRFTANQLQLRSFAALIARGSSSCRATLCRTLPGTLLTLRRQPKTENENKISRR